MITAEFNDVPSLGSGNVLASGNLGFYEAMLFITNSADAGVPVCAESKSIEARATCQAKKLSHELGAYRERLSTVALFMNSAHLNMAIGTF